MWFPSFHLPWFAWAGLAAAGAAVVIHLLNRRRYRVVHWAAMDFLREAMFRSRRILRLRDLLLLALRVLCLLAFGAALAQPYLTRSLDAVTVTDSDQPRHAVVLVDNSLGMAYENPDGTSLLDDVKAKARELIEGLPAGSRITVVPVCGAAGATRSEAYSTVQEAIRAVSAIQAVDRAARPDPAIDLALDACNRVTTMPNKRVLLITSPKLADAPGEALAEHLKQLPCRLEITRVAPGAVENAWIDDFRLVHGVANTGSKAMFLAKIGYGGEKPRTNVTAKLAIDGVEVARQTVDLQAGPPREVMFDYQFEEPRKTGAAGEQGAKRARGVRYAAAVVSLAPQDRLPADDQRFLQVPVLPKLPMVFVDQWGDQEDSQRSRRGDTWWVRRYLARMANAAGQGPQRIKVVQVKLDQLNKEVLADARLVVVAGVRSPQGAVTLLREYVEQGGRLIVAAGGEFDPAAWTQVGWLDGLGILPAPLKPRAVGHLRKDQGEPPFALEFNSLLHECFWPPTVSKDTLRGLLGPPTLFFKAVEADAGDAVAAQVTAAVAEHLNKVRGDQAKIDAQLAEVDKQIERLRPSGPDSEKNLAELRQKQSDLELQRAAVRPNWLLWGNQDEADEVPPSVEDVAEQAKPEVMGRFTNGLPFMVRRSWGRGEVLMITTGLSPQWTTWPLCEQSWWLIDRIARGMLLETVPQRTLGTEGKAGELVLPVSRADRSAQFSLIDPDEKRQSLSPEPLGDSRYAIKLKNFTRRGVYRVAAKGTKESPQEELETRLAVNGPAEASDLGRPKEQDGRKTFAEAAEAASVTMVSFLGIELSQWALSLALVGLVAELGLLGWLGSGERNT